MAAHFNQLAHELANDNIQPLQDYVVQRGLPRPVIRKNPELGTLPCQKIRYAYQYWIAQKAETGTTPGRDSIRPSRLGIALGNVSLLESIDDGRDYKYRLYGSNIAHFARQDLQGMRLTELAARFPNKKYNDGEFHLAIYQYCQASAIPCYAEYASPARQERSAWQWRRLTLPLADNKGNITMLLNCMTAIPLPTEAAHGTVGRQTKSIA
ncbi:PAS domain-containing protein [Emcibacter nanhaiensis]|uniref:PAS domain-containing protein n=1 Tax=Emcibacter nanhaiensis TaxID=1505037 RepID=A0A501PNG5_9PROT|nr:PAS domain-containing protein [Emcibacter nanhaiensis]TPD61504.1 PAS domain-containing protein [Emcibacter nanhaiensis]